MPTLALPPPPIPPGARQVIERLHAAGARALVAGGAVRDHLLGRPVQDIDVASSARPEDVARLFERTVLVGAQFGVARVLVGDEEVEVATFRADLEYHDGRHPVGVRYSSEVEDACRRDFTVNGLFYDLERGEVVDHVDGLADLASGRLRAIGDAHARFREDRLRLLRAVRFAATLGFRIETATWDALLAEAPHVAVVSGERVRDELGKILCHPRRELGFFLLADSGLMAAVLPEIEALREVPQPPEFHPEGDVHRHTGLVLGALETPDLPLALGALLHDVGKARTFSITDRIRFNRHDQVGAEQAEEICERLRLSRREREEVLFLVRRHMLLPAVPHMRRSTRARLFEEPHFETLLELGRADCLGSHRDLSSVETAREMFDAYRAEGPPRAPLLRGRDLLAAGYAAGPQLGRMLTAVEEAALEGELNTAEAARAWVAQRFGPPPGGGNAPAPEAES